jgi:hypothetical protein
LIGSPDLRQSMPTAVSSCTRSLLLVLPSRLTRLLEPSPRSTTTSLTASLSVLLRHWEGLFLRSKTVLLQWLATVLTHLTSVALALIVLLLLPVLSLPRVVLATAGPGDTIKALSLRILSLPPCSMRPSSPRSGASWCGKASLRTNLMMKIDDG